MNDDELINEIAPDVLRVLTGKGFFEALDDQMCPTDPAQAAHLCRGTHAISTAILTNWGFDQDAIADVTGVLASKGGCCDCEILFNVAEESRLKAKYWKARAAEIEQPNSWPHDEGV